MAHYLNSRRAICLHTISAGQALVEFAMVLPLLILIIMGVFDLGRAIYGYNVISNSAREGARYGIVHCDVQTSTLDVAGVRSTAISKSIGVDPADINVPAPTYTDCGYGSSLTVTVNYTFHPLTLFFTTLNLMGRATMTIE